MSDYRNTNISVRGLQQTMLGFYHFNVFCNLKRPLEIVELSVIGLSQNEIFFFQSQI